MKMSVIKRELFAIGKLQSKIIDEIVYGDDDCWNEHHKEHLEQVTQMKLEKMRDAMEYGLLYDTGIEF